MHIPFQLKNRAVRFKLGNFLIITLPLNAEFPLSLEKGRVLPVRKNTFCYFINSFKKKSPLILKFRCLFFKTTLSQFLPCNKNFDAKKNKDLFIMERQENANFLNDGQERSYFHKQRASGVQHSSKTACGCRHMGISERIFECSTEKKRG